MSFFNREKFFNNYILNTYLGQGCKFTQGQVYRILYELHSHGMLFHLDDDPSTVGNSTQDGGWVNLFTKREAAIMSTIQPALFGSSVLPDYEGDPHRICCQLTMSDPSEGRYEVLPNWGFSFDDQEDNYYRGYTRPDMWNGWGVPLLQWGDMVTILLEGQYRYEVNVNTTPDVPIVFTIYGDPNQPDYEEPLILKGFNIRTTDGSLRHVYDTSPLGLCFNVDDCQEKNPHDWEGYLW